MKAPYRIMRFERKGHHVVCVPWPQLLNRRWSTVGDEDQIEFRLSVGTIRVLGRRLNLAWSGVVANQVDTLAEGRREDGGVIRTIEFDFVAD